MNMENLSSYCSYDWRRLLCRCINRLCFKKVVKIVALVVGLFFAGLAYLQYQQIININWNKIQAASQYTFVNTC